jgi:hypothetical protein
MIINKKEVRKMGKRYSTVEKLNMLQRLIMENGSISFEELMVYSNTSPIYLKKLLDGLIKTSSGKIVYDKDKDKYIYKKLD